MKARRAACLFLFLVFLVECSVRTPVVSLPPGPLDRVEGYAALSVSSPQGSSKGKISFLLSVPQKGRLEGFGPLGRSLYQIAIDGESGILILPSKKVYWRGSVKEIVEKFLGFPLCFDEIFSLLTGSWGRISAEHVQEMSESSWALDKDKEGKVLSGQKDEVRFEIKEFFGGTGVPRILYFKDPSSSGRMKILRVGFNQPPRSQAFDLSFLSEYQAKTWPEIETIIRDEN